MKFLASLVLATTATAHYTFPALIVSGTQTTEWAYVRQWTNYYSNGPITDISSVNIRCNADGATKSAKTIDVSAGSKIGFTAKASISHPGPMLWYMAKVPEGKTAATWDGAGSVWFKVAEDTPSFSKGVVWPSQGISPPPPPPPSPFPPIRPPST
jgi:hypothetical protein